MSFLSQGTSISFPTYILPSLPFRRKSSTSSNASSSTTGSTPARAPNSSALHGTTAYIRCARCAADLCLTDQIVSRGFTGRFGRAYLVAPPSQSLSCSTTAGTYAAGAGGTRPASLPNTHTLKAVPRQLVTGLHTVSDVICASCGVGLGWKYVHAAEESQRYKVGKFILETKRISTATRWEVEDGGASGGQGLGAGLGEGKEMVMPPTSLQGGSPEEGLEFDSQDEDECEDLFLGQWTPELATRRRRARRFGKA